HGLPADIITADELLSDRAVECIERGGETLRLLVLIRIDGALRVPSGIEDKTASATDHQHDIARREIHRTGSVVHYQAAVGRDAPYLVERMAATRRSAIRTCTLIQR